MRTSSSSSISASDCRMIGVIRARRFCRTSSRVGDPARCQRAAWKASSRASRVSRSRRPRARHRLRDARDEAEGRRVDVAVGVAGRHAGRGAGRRLALEQAAQVRDVGDLGGVEPADAHPAAGHPLDPALLGQPGERVADRDRADAELLGHLPLDDPLAGGDAAALDLLADVLDRVGGHPGVARVDAHAIDHI